jgi:LacI family sucrose operon transcriptional repressor
MKVTIQDIANMVGVSKSTVSRYLNGGYVSDENIKKIQEAIEKTEFKSNFFARRLKAKNSRLIGIIIPRIDSYTTGKILRSINNKLELAGYQGIILSSELDVNKEIDNMKKLYGQDVDGIIVMSIRITKEHIDLVNKASIPVIFTGQNSNLVNCIKIDDRKAGLMLGEYIKEEGHRNIVFLGVTEEDIAVGIDRKAGFFQAFEGEDCTLNFVEAGFSFSKAYEMAEKVMEYKPTAVIGATDNIVLGFLRYAVEKGYDVPNEISVAGFGGYDVGLAIHPPITTIAIDYEVLGGKIADLIISSVEGVEFAEDKNIPIELVKRQSVISLNKK